MIWSEVEFCLELIREASLEKREKLTGYKEGEVSHHRPRVRQYNREQGLGVVLVVILKVKVFQKIGKEERRKRKKDCKYKWPRISKRSVEETASEGTHC